MNVHLLADEALRERLWRDCALHETLVREVVSAHTAGQLEGDVSLRTIALELHSVKGVASVLGLGQVVSMIGTLCEAMLHRESVSHESFWPDFSDWFGSLLACMKACADGGVERDACEAMKVRRDELLRALGDTRDVRALHAAASPRRKLSPSSGRRLLLVDDSATVRAALSARLVDRGYPVRTAKSLSETAQILAEFDPEIVVTDVRMPDVEGDELCRRIKSQMMRVVPVILYSGLPEQELAARARDANADGYVCKIRGVDGLIERMDELLSDEILF